MTLQTYKKKRVLKKSQEPKAKKTTSGTKKLPVFCVQKHAASHLHYDFRIECEGVMLSWAIPKGPSLDPNQKRLAIHVEDHPIEYRHFEGIIPEGNYGAGTVMIWDEGLYTVSGCQTKKEVEKTIFEGLKKGHIEFDLMGEKLQGGFVLVRTKQGDGEKNWLFIKRKDTYADSKLDIMSQDLSVRTGRTIQEISGQIEETQKKKSLVK